MAVANDALSLDARRVPKAKQINAKRTVVEHDALSLDARRVPKGTQINAKRTEAANDVQIASLGQIRDVGQSHMMDIVQHVSSNCSPPMNEVRSFTPTQRKSGFAMQSMMPLKDSFMINHYTQDNAIALIVVALTIAN
jgi:hypothetical protein